MKTFLSVVSLGVALVGLLASPVSGQSVLGQSAAYNPASGPTGTFSPFHARLPVVWPGNVWVDANLADRGLGYSGSYVTLGGKTRLFEDFLDGRWVMETQGHVSLEAGGFFGNLGVERYFSIDAAQADVYLGAYWDHDGDEQGNFSHTFNQLGISAGILTERYDIVGNGYLPSGNNNYTQGDITGQQVFLGNNIVTQAGMDSALEGFDYHFLYRPESLGFVNGHVDLGGYHYQSDLIDMFSGVSAGIGIQGLRGMGINLQLNHDNRFETTGVLQFSWLMGARGARTEYSPVGRDLEPTRRNDHITRYQQDLLLAIDPDTGTPYVVWHVDNTAAAGGDGSFERPFRTLAEAQAASGFENVIFVRAGDGTTTGMDSGITLKQGQLLLGDGIVHTIPELRLGTFDVFNLTDGVLPTITNTAGNGVTLASDNTVRGFVIDGTGSFMSNGIFGDGGLGTLEDGIIEQVTIQGSPLLNGISLNNISGDWTFADNNISTAGADGIFIDNVTGATSTLTFTGNDVSSNGRDGIHVEDYDGAQFVFEGNNTDSNIRDGISLTNYTGTSGLWSFEGNTVDGNIRYGININGATGSYSFLDDVLTNNTTAGLNLVDAVTGVNGSLVIDNLTATGNGIGVSNELNTGVQNFTLTGSTIDSNTMGLYLESNNAGTVLNANIVDNLSFSNNSTDAIRLVARSGSQANFLLENSGAALVVDGNAASSGIGIALFAEGAGADLTVLNAVIRNVAVTNNGSVGLDGGIYISGQTNSLTTALIEDVTLAGTSAELIADFDTNNVFINSLRTERITASGFDITAGNTTRLDYFGANLTASSSGFSFVAADNTMTRMRLYNSTFSGNQGDGVFVNTTGNAVMLAEIVGVTANDNGQAGVGAGVDADVLPLDGIHGFNIRAEDTSRLSLRFTDNDAHNNFQNGLAVQTLGTAQIDLLMERNSLTLNDVGDDDDPEPPTDGLPPENDWNDVNFENSAGGTIALAMSNNFFAYNAFLTNNGAAANFIVELDGATNVSAPVLVGGAGNFTVQAFGTSVEPTIVAQEGVFSGAGFP